MPSLESEFARLMDAADVPGVSVAVIREDRTVQYVNCGMRRAQAPDVVDEQTVFEAASLSKPVFAHAILQLADQGRLSLTAPLGDYLPCYVPGDPRASSVTASDVLSHCAGFPNWRGPDFPLRTYFQSRDRFSYSGEGYLYLQKAVEAVTGEKMHSLVDELVFEPFAMNRSSFVWHPRLDGNRAYPHDAFGKPALTYKPGEMNAAWSLQTTASDFARFLLAVLDGSRLRPETTRLWLRPQIEIRHRGIQSLKTRDEDTATRIGWGLGWGLELDTGMFFHWGDNGPSTAFTIGAMEQSVGLVIFTNGASGLSIIPDLITPFMPGERPSLVWLDYVRYDAAVRRMLRAARTNGVKEVWPEIERAELDGPELRWIAQGLNACGREEDSLWLRSRIDERSPAAK